MCKAVKLYLNLSPVLQVYFWICIFSFFQKLREEERRQKCLQEPAINPEVTYSPVPKV